MLSSKLTWSNCTNSNFANSLSKGDPDKSVVTWGADGRAQVSKWPIIRFSKVELMRYWWCVSEIDAHCWLFVTDTSMYTTEENLNGSLPHVLMSAAVFPECITMFPDHRSTPDLRGSPRGRPQETDRPETRHYVIMTSECCPVLC